MFIWALFYTFHVKSEWDLLGAEKYPGSKVTTWPGNAFHILQYSTACTIWVLVKICARNIHNDFFMVLVLASIYKIIGTGIVLDKKESSY